MAGNDYSINVTAKINVQQLKSQIKESINQTTISVAPKFSASIDDKNIAKLKNTIANYINKETISLENFSINEQKVSESIQKINNNLSKKLNLSAGIEIDKNKYQDFVADVGAIQNVLKELKNESKIKLGFDLDSTTFEQFKTFTSNLQNLPTSTARIGFSQEDIINVTKQIVALSNLKEALDKTNFNIHLNVEDNSLNNLKNNIEQYFQANPVVLTVSQDVNDVELGSIADRVAELLQLETEAAKQQTEEEKEAVKEALEEIKQEREKASSERAKKEEEDLKESQQKMQDFVNSEKEILHQRTEAQTQDLRDRGQALLDYANESKEASSNAISEIETLENEAVNSLMRVIQESNATDLYKEETNRLLTLYKQSAIDFETFHNDLIEKMKQAQESGLVSEDLINKTADKLHDLENVHQQSLNKQAEQQEKARQQEQEKEIKSYEKQVEERRKQGEKLVKQEAKNAEDIAKAKEQAWNQEAQNIQDSYNKQLISAEEYVSRMQKLLPEAFENGYKNADKYANSLEKVKQQQEAVASTAQTLEPILGALMGYLGITKIFSAIKNSFSKMVGEVRELDVELTEFSKVSDLSTQQTEEFIDSCYDLGDAVAKTGTEVVTATTLFKKMGNSLEDSMEYAKDALMWTNVADGMVSVDEAATMLISTMKAFEDQGLTSTHVIDALNEVSNNYSTSSSALSNNLSTVAATLAVSNTTFEETVGLLTAGIEIMPDKASKVANGLKTISQRIRQIDGDTADKLDEFLGSKGISRFDETTGQLKGTYELLGEISQEWANLTENERQYIGETMAGKNQITVLNALMMNFSTAIKATETAMNSAGSAAKENERVLDSIQGHIQKFQSAFEKLSHNLINSHLVKEVIDLGTNGIRILDKVLAILKPILAIVEAIVTLANVPFKILDESTERLEKQKQLFIDIKKERLSTIDGLIEKYQTLQSSYDLENLTHEELIDISRQIIELDEGKLDVDKSINEQIQERIKNLYVEKGLLAGVNEEASKTSIAFDAGVGGIKNAMRSLLSTDTGIGSLIGSLTGKNVNYKELLNSNEIALSVKEATLQGILDALKEVPQEERGLNWLNVYDTVSSDLEAIKGKVDEVNNYAKEAIQDMLIASGQDIKKMSDEEINDILAQIDGVKDKTNILFNITTDPDQIEALRKLLNDELFARAQANADGAAGAIDNVGTSLAGAIALMSDYASQAQILAQAQDDITNSGVITAETLKKIADAGLEAYLVYDEDTKSLVVNTQAFFDNNAALEDNAIAKFVTGEQTKYTADIEAILSDNLNTTTNSLGVQTTATYQSGEAALDAAKKYGEETKAVAELRMAEGELTEAQFEAIQARTALYKQNLDAGVAALRGYYSNVTNARTATSRGASHGSTSSSKSSSSSSSSKSTAEREAEQAAKDAEKAWKNAFDVEYKILKTYLDAELISNEEYYDALEQLNKKYFEDRVGYEEEFLKYQDEIIKGKQKLIDETFNRGESYLQHQLNMNKITQKQYLDYLESLYTAYYKDREELEEKLWKIEEERYKLEQQQLETTIGYAIDVIDEEIDKLKEKKKALEEVNEEMEEQLTLQQLEDSLEEAKNRKIKVYRKGEGFVYEQDLTAISTAQTALDKYKQEVDHKKRLSNIDEEIKKLEEYKKQWKNITENYKKNQDEMTAKSILGENARERILRQEIDAVTQVSDRYNELKGTLASSNEETSENFEEYIGDKDTAGTVIYRIHKLREEIAALQSKTVEVRVNTVTTTNGVPDSGGSYYSGGSGSGSGSGTGSGSGSGSSGTQGPSVGASVKIKPEYQSGFYYGTHDFKVWGYDWEGNVQIISTQATDDSAPTYAVPVEYLVGYASGTLGTSSNVFKINENGLEALVTPSGTVMNAPTTGYGVIKNEYTERLTDFAADPLQFLSQAFEGYSGNYQNNQSTNETININGDISLPNVDDGLSFIDSIKTLAIQYTTRRI